jgi:hypothetical protein
MGTWGSGLFEDDLASDIQGSFESEIGRGQSREKAAQCVLREYEDEMDDPDDGPVLYLSLASLLLDSGVTEHAVLSRSLRIIENEEGLARWREAGDDALQERRAIYGQLRQRIEAVQDPKSPSSKRTRVKLPKIGDYLQIPLSDGRYAYGQYVYQDAEQGPLLQLLDKVSRDPLNAADLSGARPLFRPIITYLNHAIRTGRWQVVGRGAVSRFAYPGFIGGNADKSGKIGEWWYWDGSTDHRIGRLLPPKYKDCEFLMLWSLESVEERIRTGHDPHIDRLRQANQLD